MYNTLSVNPAYAGSRESLSISGLHRNQWIGLNGAPVTQTVTVNSAVGSENKIGIGGSIINDKIGPTQETYFDVAFSYTIPTSVRGKLSFGVKAGGHLLDVNFNDLNQYTNTDALLENNIDNKFSPNVGIGLYYTDDKLYLGASAPNLPETKHFNESNLDNDASSFIAEERVNFYAIGGYVFDVNPSLKFKPATLLKLVAGAPVQVDLSANFLAYEKVTLGLAYRWSAAISLLTGFQVTDTILLGFAYDWETTALGNTEFNSGSFEVLMRYEVFRNKKILYPRFF